MGFEPERTTPDARFCWARISDILRWPLKEPTTARHIKQPTGEEIAWRTLNMEKITEPCILSPFAMKREFYQYLTHKNDIYENAADTAIEAFILSGANLDIQFIMPSPDIEHMAVDPLSLKIESAPPKIEETVQPTFNSPEDVRDAIERLPDPATLERNFDLETAANAYAGRLKKLREIARGEMLFISDFGQADFMGGYTRWGYTNYLAAFALYPEHLKRYYQYTGEWGRLYNMAIVRAVEKYGIAPFVYSGQDICFNDGPICSPQTLDELYFPYLVRAVQPLHDAGIKIIWHCDGDVRLILPQLINRVGVAGFQGFQEETGCTLETIASLKTREGRKPIIIGSVSVTTTLPFGTVEDVKKDVERCFRVAATGGGFGLASSSSILPETPLSNILAMTEHGRRFGKKFLRELYGRQ
jgi:hypothetical protein